MSWPTDGLPRYKVAEPYGAKEDDGKMWIYCHVYDRAYCHEVAYTARGATRWGARAALVEAQREAARMESEHMQVAEGTGA